MTTATQTIPSGYKKTDISVIPEDWEERVFKILYSEASRNGIYKTVEFRGHGTRIVNMGEMFGFEFISDQEMSRVALTSKELVLFGLQDGDLLFGRRSIVPAGAGKCSIVTALREPLTFESSIIRVRLNFKEANPLFYYYFFTSQVGRSVMSVIVSGTNVKGIRASELKELKVPVPPFFEQTAIATVLSDTDALIERLEKLIVKKKAIKQGTMQQLLTGKKRLPGFSGEWVEKKLRDIADFLKGRGLSKNKIVNDGNYFCILYGELFTTYSQVIKEVISKTNSREGLISVMGDILMPGSTTTVGIDLATASSLQQNDVFLGGDLIVIRKKGSNKYNSEFLANYLTHISKYKIAEIAQGITIIHLHGSRLQEILVKIPSDIKEQIAIATVISDMDAEIESLVQKRDKYTMLKQGMMQQLLTGRIRVYANN